MEVNYYWKKPAAERYKGIHLIRLIDWSYISLLSEAKDS